MMSTFGRVPLPSILIRDIPSNINTAWDDLGPRTIRAVVWHRMLGSLGGTDTFFRGEGRASASPQSTARTRARFTGGTIQRDGAHRGQTGG